MPITDYTITIKEKAADMPKYIRDLLLSLNKLMTEVSGLRSDLKATRPGTFSSVRDIEKFAKKFDKFSQSVENLSRTMKSVETMKAPGLEGLQKEIAAESKKVLGAAQKTIAGKDADVEFDKRISKLINELAEMKKLIIASGRADAKAIEAALSRLMKAFSVGGKGDPRDYEIIKPARLLKEKAAKDLENTLNYTNKELLSAANNFRSLAETTAVTDKTLVNFVQESDKAAQNINKAFVDIKKTADIKSSIEAAVFKQAAVRPTEKGVPYVYRKGPGVAPTANIPQVEGRINYMVDDLSKSLKKLQENMVKSIQKGLRKGLEVMRTETGEFFELGKGEREWELRIVDVGKLKRELKDAFGITVDLDAAGLADAYRQAYIKRESGTRESADVMANQLYRWFEKVGREEIRGTSDYVRDMYEKVRGGAKDVEQLRADPRLKDVYKSTVLQAEAMRHMAENFFKSVSVPAARVTEQGTTAFETKYGAERALANFATLTTGIERLTQEFKALGGGKGRYAEFLTKAAEVPLRPTIEERGESEKLARDLISGVKQLGGKELITTGYREAVALRKMERKEIGGAEASAELMDTTKSLEELEKEAQRLNISALDVANALNQINLENFYDVLNRLYSAGKVPFLQTKAGTIDWPSTLRDIAEIKQDLLGVMPLIEPGRPKRRPYEEDVVRILTKATEKMRPEEQKRHIKDVSLVWADMAENARKLEKAGIYTGKEYLGIQEARPIDLSDAASSHLVQFNKSFANSLRSLDKTMMGASVAGIRGQAPFEAFSSISRQYTNLVNALEIASKEAELPAIVSTREKGMIQAGKYGTGGFGVNVLTELRNTAATFEDQIVISGRLAKAFTKIVKPLVGPAAELAERTTPMKPGLVRVGGRAAGEMLGAKTKQDFENLVKNITGEFQEVLGIKQKYRGRADVAEIGDRIENVMREHRGETIEVQTAKLTEIFLNYFGRKLATRFGTKGVAVGPTAIPTEIKEIQDIAKAMAGGLAAKVEPGAGLGFARMPKSVGEMIADMLENTLAGEDLGWADIFSKEVLSDLIDRLRASGNKFILDLFSEASHGIVTKEEAEKQKRLFVESADVYQKLFGQALSGGVTGIEKVQEDYVEQLGKAPFKLQPIEARISARGIAKRGLMPEVLEGMVNNLIGSLKDVTEIKDVALTADPAVREKMNSYLRALTYSGLDAAEKEAMTKRLKAEGAGAEDIKRLQEFEKQWTVYTDIVDEYGKTMKSFVAPKFMQIVEEPHIYKGWSEKELEKGTKGARLNYQAFAAYAGIFGEGSSMLKELAESTSLASREGWELIKALQMMDPSMKETRESMLSSLKEVKLADIKPLEKGTATIDELKGTLFDIARHPEAFKIKIPTTVPGAEKFYEEMYVPGPALRSTYKEELLGKEAPTEISRQLSNLINAAKNVEDIMMGMKQGITGPGMEKFASTLRSEITQSLVRTYKEAATIEAKKQLTPENVKMLEGTLDKLKSSLTGPAAPVYQALPRAKRAPGAQTALEAVEAYEQKLRTKADPRMYTKVLGRIMDMLVGVQPEELRKEQEKITTALRKYKETGAVPGEYKKAYEMYGRGGKVPFEDVMGSFRKRIEEKREAVPIFDVELRAGNLEEFAEKMGVSMEVTTKEALERAMQSLGRAKVKYYESLAKQVLGPKKAIEQTFFQRTIPAITGKAVSAITDKTEDLYELLDLLEGKKFGIELDMPNIDELRKKLKEIIADHEEYIKKSKQLGLPVLKEREIGLSPMMAKALKVKGMGGEETNLAKLIKERKKMTQDELDAIGAAKDVFVESVRYPFYGTVSVQPHKARLMEEEQSKYAITVPGAPQLDLAELNNIVDQMREHVFGKGGLLQRREEAWAEGTDEGAQKAMELTNEITKLIEVIKRATPTFINMEQKLDYDGDALFVHTGQLEESRKEIQSHFNALGEDITSVRSLFSTLFTAVKETESKSMAEMAYTFEKKHPAEKGFEWLTKPYITKEVQNLGFDEVKQALESYSKDIMKLEIEPEVYRKLGGRTPEAAGMEAGMFEKTATELTEELARRKLWEQKYSDAIIGQLYKLHTGPTVESISRLVRTSEIETGFGKGLAKTGGASFEPSEEFLRMWPAKSAALGGRPVQEFAARMNEIMRFIIQKGMDEKHAGVRAVGADILENVAKKGGANLIINAMEAERDQFGELWDFNEQIATEAKLRLGALPTQELMGELKRFELGKMSTKDIQAAYQGLGDVGSASREVMTDSLVEAAKQADISKDREQIINEIISYIDLEAVFQELFRQIKRTAVKGYTKELQTRMEELPFEQRVKMERQVATAGGMGMFAKQEIEEQAARPKGVSILKYVTANLQPLYKMRTSMETLAAVAKRTGMKPEIPEMMLPKAEAGDLKKSFEDVTKASHVLSQALESVVPAGRGDIHRVMTFTALQKKYMDIQALKGVAERAKIPMERGMPLPTTRMPIARGATFAEVPKLAAEVWKEAVSKTTRPGPAKKREGLEILEYENERIRKQIGAAADRVEELSQMAGIPLRAPEEEAEEFYKWEEQHQDALKRIEARARALGEGIARTFADIPKDALQASIDKYGDTVRDLLKFQVSMTEQLRRVSESIRDVPLQEKYFRAAFPGYEKVIRKESAGLANDFAKKEKENFEELKAQRAQEQKVYQQTIEDFYRKEIRPKYAKGDIPTMTEAADETVKESIRAVDEISSAMTDAVIQRKRLALRALAEKATGGINIKEEVPLFELYRASGLMGGGGYKKGGRPTPQVEAIVKKMAGLGKPGMLAETTAFRGTALHAKKQKEIIEKYSEYGEIQTETLIEDLDNMITGHLDVLYTEMEGGRKLAEIKSVYSPEKFRRVAAGAEKIAAGKMTLDEYIKKLQESGTALNIEIARKLEGYVSQVNFYLSKYQDAVAELILVSTEDPTKEIKIEVGKFDPERFKRDVEAVKKARSIVGKMMYGAGTGQLGAELGRYREIYESVASGIGQDITPGRFKAALPKTASLKTLRESQGELTKNEQELFDRLSKEYLKAYETMGERRRRSFWSVYGGTTTAAGGAAGAPPPPGAPPAPPGGGDGGDDFEEMQKRVAALLARLREGSEIDTSTAMKLIEELTKAEEHYYASMAMRSAGNKKLIDNYAKLMAEIQDALNKAYEGGLESAKEAYKILKQIPDDMSRMAKDYSVLEDLKIDPRGAQTPKALHTNLKALLDVATRFYGLADVGELGKFGGGIEDLIKQVREKGPAEDITRRIMSFVEGLPQEKKGGMVKIWQFYRQAVGTYFMKQLDALAQEIQAATTEDETRQAQMKYERLLERYVTRIKQSLGSLSDIYTTKVGGMREFVNPQLAQMTGIYRGPKEITEIARQRAALGGEFKPIFEELVGDLSPMAEEMITPLEKVRSAFKSLTEEDMGMRAILDDAELFSRIGDQAVEAWDFDKLIRGVTKLRAALQSYNRMQIGGLGTIGFAEDYTESMRKNVEDTIKYFKQLEQMLTATGAKGAMGTAGVPPFLDPKTQQLLHKRNIAQIRKFFETAEEMGGAKMGQAFTYRYKIIDPATKQTLSSMAEEFRKVGEAVDDSGNRIGVFKERSDDLIKSMQGRRGLGQAFGRVIRWGVASRTVYGMVNALGSAVNTMADVESGIAVLRQVMSPLETDFRMITDASLDFAKEFGQPIRGVIDSMRVFAQQGLAQEEVIDRTRTATLAANVSTLTAADATEALTAATRVFGKEAESSVRFLDAWNEVEARHAITSADLANALKKAAAAAKTSGFSFDELNAIITGIGETSRQTGKEIGTSLRFIFRRMQAERAPKELGKIGVPVLTPSGDLRKGFNIMGDLADKWKELSNAQRLSIAQAIGGRRHYNNVIILMDHWQDALDALTHSINSKGAAERRNAIVMETYAKKVQQVRAAVAELQVQFGRAFLPIAKAGLTGLKFLIEAFTNIPPSVKVAATAITGLFALITKGGSIMQRFSDFFVGGKGIFGDFFSSLSNEFRKGIFEIFGKRLGGIDLSEFLGGVKLEGLKQITEASGIRDLETFLGKFAYTLTKVGQSWNNFLTSILKGGAITSKGISDVLNAISKATFGLSATIGIRGSGPIGLAIRTLMGGFTSLFDLGGYGFEKLGKYIGLTGQQMAKLTKHNTGLVGSLGPMVGTFAALTPLLNKGIDGFKMMALSAQDYEKSIDGIRRKTSGELADIKNLSAGYDKLSKKLEDIRESRKPEVKKRQQEREEYKSPLLTLGTVYGETTDYANRLADTNIDLVSSFDEFGNAVLKNTGNLKSYIKVMEEAKFGEMAKTEVGVLSKYIQDLTKTTGLETFKNELKTFVKEIPAIGPLLARSIKVSPAKELDLIVNKMNELLALRSKYPLTTAFDVDIEDYKKKLEEARGKYRETYKDFRRVLAELPTEGLTPTQISEMFGGEEFKKGFELMVRLEPRLQVGELKGQVDWKDVFGSEVLKRIYPEKPIDIAGPLTKGLLEQSNAIKRETEAFSGDVVIFSKKALTSLTHQQKQIQSVAYDFGKESTFAKAWEDIAWRFNVAGNQAVLNMRETTDGVTEWFVTYVDKELGQLVEKPWADVEPFVQAIFPTRAIEDRLYGNIEALKEFVAGAGAGLRGVTEKEFKREFDLGARFFGGIPTTTLLQTAKGFEPFKGYGEVGFKTGWDKWIKKNYIEPMTEYNNILEQTANMQLEVGEAELSPAFLEDLTKLQNILKNNQVVLQYRAAHEDLMKSLSESQRVLKENIAAERNRAKYIVQTSGYLKGLPEDMSDFNTGVQRFEELSSQQRLMYREKGTQPEERTFTNLGRSIKEDMMTRESLVRSIDEIDKTLIGIKEIGDVAEAFGAALPVDELGKYVEEIAVTGDKGTGLLLGETKNITANTAQTVDRLDDLLAHAGDQQAIERQVMRLPALGLGHGDIRDFVKRLEYGAELREKVAEKGDSEMVAAVDRSLDELVSQMVGKYGIKESLKALQEWRYRPMLGLGREDFTRIGLLQRTLGGASPDMFVQAMAKAQPNIAETPEFQELLKIQQENRTEQIVSNKSLNKLLAIYSTFEHFNKVASNRQIKSMDYQLNELRDQKKEFEKTGKDTSGLSEKIEELTKARAAVSEKVRGQAIRELIAPIAIASQEIARSLGVTDKQLRILGGTVGATYLAWKVWASLSDEPIPEYIEELGEKSKEAAQRMAQEGVKGTAWKAWYATKGKAEQVFGKTLEDDLKKAEDKIKKGRIFTEEEARKAAEKGMPEKGVKPLRDKIVSAIEEVKKKPEKAAAMDEQLLRENQAQTGVLLGIYEQAKRGAENTSTFTNALHGEMQSDRKQRVDEVDSIIDGIDELRSEYMERRARTGGRPVLREIAAIGLAAGAAGYIQEKRGPAARANEMERRARRETELVEQLIDTYPDVAAKAAEDQLNTTKKAADKTVTLETEKVRRAVDVAKEEAKITDKLTEDRQKFVNEVDKINEKLSESANKLAEGELSEEFKRQIELMEEAIKGSKLAQEFENKFVTEISGVMAGRRVPQLALGERNILNVPAAGRIRSGFFEKLFGTGFEATSKEFESMMQERETLIAKSRETITEIAKLEGKELSDIEEKRYSMLKDSLGSLEDRIKSLNKSLADSADTLEEAIVAEELRMERVSTANTMLAEQEIAVARRATRGGRGLEAGRPAFAGGIEFGPRQRMEMQAQQRLLSENKEFRKTFEEYQDKSLKLDQETARRDELIRRRRELEFRKTEEERVGGVRPTTLQELESVELQLNETAGAVEALNGRLSVLADASYAASKAMEFQIKAEQTRASAVDEFARQMATIRTGAPALGYLGGLGIAAGAAGELPMPKGRDQLTASERLYAGAVETSNTALVREIELYQEVHQRRQSEIGLMRESATQIVRFTREMQAAEQAGDPEAIQAAKDALNAQVEAHKKLQISVSDLNSQLSKLAEIPVAMNIASLVGDLEKLKTSFKEGWAAARLGEEIAGVREMRPGGRHPLAPVVPTYEMFAAGIPSEKLWKTTKYEAEKAMKIARSGTWTMYDQQKRMFDEERDLREWEQHIEYSKMEDQEKHAWDLWRRMNQARRELEMLPEGPERAEAINKINEQQAGLEDQMRTAWKVEEGTFKGFDFESFQSEIGSILEQFGSDEIVTELRSGSIATMLEQYLGKEEEEKTIFGKISEVLVNLMRSITGKQEPPKEELPDDVLRYFQFRKAAGGTIYGPGGPKEDRVLIAASPGEYVIRASSAKKLGSGLLSYMNQTGQIPGFAEGAEVREFIESGGQKKKFFGGAEDLPIPPDVRRYVLGFLTGQAGEEHAEALRNVIYNTDIKTLNKLKESLDALSQKLFGEPGLLNIGWNQAAYNKAFMKTKKPIEKSGKSDFEKGMEAVSHTGTRQKALKEIMESMRQGGLIKRFAEGDKVEALDEYTWGMVRNYFQNENADKPLFLPEDVKKFTKQYTLPSMGIKEKDIDSIKGAFKGRGDPEYQDRLRSVRALKEAIDKGSITSWADYYNTAMDVFTEKDFNKFVDEMPEVLHKKRSGGLIEKLSIGGEIAGRKAGELVSRALGTIPQYKDGISYVPHDQLAFLHAGESVTPAGYAEGGAVRGAAAKGRSLEVKVDVGDIKDAITEAIEKTKLELKDNTVVLDDNVVVLAESDKVVTLKDTTVTAVLDENATVKAVLDTDTVGIDTTALENSLSGLERALASINLGGGVGADEASQKIDQFIEVSENRFASFERAISDNLESINEIKVANIADDIEVDSLSQQLNTAFTEIDNIRSQLETELSKKVTSNSTASEVDSKIQELSDTLTNRLALIEITTNNLTNSISALEYDIANQEDRLNSNIARIGMEV